MMPHFVAARRCVRCRWNFALSPLPLSVACDLMPMDGRTDRVCGEVESVLCALRACNVLVCVTVCLCFLCPPHTPQQFPRLCCFEKNPAGPLSLPDADRHEHRGAHRQHRGREASGVGWAMACQRRQKLWRRSISGSNGCQMISGNAAITENKNGKRPVSADSMAGAAAARKNAKADGQAVAGAPMVPRPGG